MKNNCKSISTESEFCEDCKTKIENAKSMEVIPICSKCANKKPIWMRGKDGSYIEGIKIPEYMTGIGERHKFIFFMGQQLRYNKANEKYKIVAECKCGKQEINIEEITNSFGYIEECNWQCPTCWQMVNLFVEGNNEEKI